MITATSCVAGTAHHASDGPHPSASFPSPRRVVITVCYVSWVSGLPQDRELEVVELTLHPCGVLVAALLPVQLEGFTPHRARLVVLSEGAVRMARAVQRVRDLIGVAEGAAQGGRCRSHPGTVAGAVPVDEGNQRRRNSICQR